jgi:hypothetical protein
MATPIGTLGSVDSWTIAGREFVNVPNMVVLRGYTSGSSSTSLCMSGTTVGYQVPAGKTLSIYAVELICSSSTPFDVSPLYMTTDVGFNASPSAPVSPIYNFGNQAAANLLTTSLTNYQIIPMNYLWVIPATFYPGYVTSASGGVVIFLNAYGTLA